MFSFDDGIATTVILGLGMGTAGAVDPHTWSTTSPEARYVMRHLDAGAQMLPNWPMSGDALEFTTVLSPGALMAEVAASINSTRR